MGLFDKIKAGLQKTQAKLVHEIKRIISGSPKLDAAALEALEHALLGADLGLAMTHQITAAVRHAYETQGGASLDVFAIARREIAASFPATNAGLHRQAQGLTVISVVGVNGTGKTTTCAKLANLLKLRGDTVVVAACDTFRAAAVEQIKLWGQRLQFEVIAGAYHADPAAVAHDAITAATARKSAYLLLDTAGRLHTKHNLMTELQKIHRVISKQCAGAPHEVLLVLDGSTGMNAMNQAREFHKAAPLTGLIVTKLDGTSKGGMVVAIQKELGLPVKFIGLGEQPDDLQPFVPQQFAEALFADK